MPLTLFHFDGLSHTRIAVTLGVPEATVRSLVHRARRKLAPLLAAFAAEPQTMPAVDDVFKEQIKVPRMLHVMNGDSTRVTFEQSDIPGDVTVYADVLLEGPVPAGLTDTEMQLVRERFHAEPGEVDPGANWHRGLEAYPQYEEVVLWFEHDLFDQLLLIRHLDWFARRGLGSTKLSLICIGRFPGIEMFLGLGQLTPDQLLSLLDTRAAVTATHVELGRRAWRAFTSPDPREIERVLESDTSALPFLGAALRRWLQEFPAKGSGLPRFERDILSVLAAGPQSIWSLFHALFHGEVSLLPTDSSFMSRIEALASGPRPLIAVHLESGDAPRRVTEVNVLKLPKGTVTITDAGSEVLAGKADWPSLTPFDRWLGGVHVTTGSMWRWDVADGRIWKE